MTVKWHFVTDGKGEPSDWRPAEHWCEVCMEMAIEHLKAMRA